MFILYQHNKRKASGIIEKSAINGKINRQIHLTAAETRQERRGLLLWGAPSGFICLSIYSFADEQTGDQRNDLFYTLMKGISNGSSTFASCYAANEAKALVEIETLVEIVKALPN